MGSLSFVYDDYNIYIRYHFYEKLGFIVFRKIVILTSKNFDAALRTCRE